MINVTFINSYAVKKEFGALVIFRAIQIAIENGIGPGIAAAFAAYGFVLSSLSKHREGFRYGQLAISLVDRFRSREWIPRVYISVYGYVNHFFYPIREMLAPLRIAHRTALMSGDNETSAIAATLFLMIGFHAGVHLLVLENDAVFHCHSLVALGQTFRLLITLPLWSLVSKLSHGSANTLDLTGDITCEEEALEFAIKENNEMVIAQYHNYHIVYWCLMGDYHKALDMVKHWRKVKTFTDYIVCFYECIALLAVAQSCPQRFVTKHVRRGRKLLQCMKGWARECPSNFFNKQALMEAEMSSLLGNTKKALACFDRSISAASKEGLIQEEGFAYERLGDFHFRLGNILSAKPCYERARDAYSRWGADVLVDCISERLQMS